MAPRNEIEEKSSFPGIWKRPAGIGKPFRTANDWMQAKREDDSIGGLWRVHDKLYDLSSFVHSHPGGPQWLELTKGTDITEAFESSHVKNASLVESTLAGHFVRDATSPRLSPYTFLPDGFYKTLKRRIEPVLQKVGTEPTRELLLMQDGMVFAFVALMILGTSLDLWWMKVISGVILAWQLIGAHNFFHLKDNWRKYYWDLGLMSSREWMVTHSLSHHLYPNTLLDIELELFPTYEFLPNRAKNWFQMYAPPVYSHFLYAIGFWVDFGKRLYNLAKGTQKPRIENGIVIAQLALLAGIAPTIQSGIYSWILIHTVSSFVFLTQGATAAHHHPEIFHDGDESRPAPDFGLCQLDATRDRAGEIHKNLWWILVSFGEHCLHHLFPTICHSKLHHIKPIFEQTLKDFSEEFPPMFQWDLYLGHFQQLKRTEAKPFKGHKKE